MKVLNVFRSCILLICTILLFASCKKENLTKLLIGNYTGLATLGKFPAVNSPATYPACKVIITKVDGKKIQLTITPNPAGPSNEQFNEESTMTDNNNFLSSHGGSRQPTTIVKGILQGDQLSISIETTFSSGPEFKFYFFGKRD